MKHRDRSGMNRPNASEKIDFSPRAKGQDAKGQVRDIPPSENSKILIEKLVSN